MNTSNIIKNESSEEESDIDTKSLSKKNGTPVFT